MANAVDRFYQALKSEDIDGAKTILDGMSTAELNSPGRDGEYVLHSILSVPLGVSRDKMLELLTLAISKGADVNAKNRDGDTPLMYALNLDEADFAELLIAKGADVAARNKKNETVFSFAIQNDKFDLLQDPSIRVRYVEILIEAGADVNGVAVTSSSPLLYASIHGYTEIVSLLLDNGANIEYRNNNDNTALMLACDNSHKETAQLLLEKGADPNVKSIHGVTSLMIACDSKDIETAKLLLEHGATLDLQDNSGITALYVACFRVDIAMAQLLLDKGANPNLQDRNGKTPLMVACIKNNKPIVELLLEKGANRDLTNKAGKTAGMLTTDPEIKSLVSQLWKGYAKSDVDLLHSVFDKPSDISLCPICLEYAERQDGCMYMKHTCGTPRHEGLHNLFKDGQGKTEWCTLCGRITQQHRHFKLSLPTDPRLPEFASEKPGSNARYFDKNCIDSGGGGHEEKIRRLNRLLQYACELQSQSGKLTKDEALTELVEEMWIAAASRNRSVPKILESKKFDFPCTFPDDAAETTRPDAPEFPDVPRPADEKDLTPIRHDAPDNVCSTELGPHDDGRPVFQFRHKQADGSIYEHKDEYICGQDLEEAIRANEFTGMCPINPAACRAKLYPEELKGVVSDEYYEIYRKNFNRVNATARGGAVAQGDAFFRPAHGIECAMPPKKAGKLKTYRKKSKHNATYRRGLFKKVPKE